MHDQIVRIQDKPFNTLIERHIFGLNLFPDSFPPLGDPRLQLLRGICAQNIVSALLGSLQDFAHEPEELFGGSRYSGKYTSVRIGCIGGEFYDSNNTDRFPPLFFPEIESDFIDIPRHDGSLVFDIMYLDALVLFILPKNDSSIKEMIDLLDRPFFSSTTFLEQAAGLYELIMTTGADADHFTFYSTETESFDLLNKPLENTVQSIERSAWYKEVASTLVWDDEYSRCLVQK